MVPNDFMNTKSISVSILCQFFRMVHVWLYAGFMGILSDIFQTYGWYFCALNGEKSFMKTKLTLSVQELITKQFASNYLPIELQMTFDKMPSS